MVFHFREWVTYAHSKKVPIDEMILVWGGLWMAQTDKDSVRSSLVAIFLTYLCRAKFCLC